MFYFIVRPFSPLQTPMSSFILFSSLSLVNPATSHTCIFDSTFIFMCAECWLCVSNIVRMEKVRGEQLQVEVMNVPFPTSTPATADGAGDVPSVPETSELDPAAAELLENQRCVTVISHIEWMSSPHHIKYVVFQLRRITCHYAASVR